MAKAGERRCNLSVEIEADDWDTALAYLADLAREIQEKRAAQPGPLSIHTSILANAGQATATGYERPVGGVG